MSKKLGPQAMPHIKKMKPTSITYSTSNPNQLQSVSDQTGSPLGVVSGSGNYTYDLDGNLTSDPYKGIATIFYNSVNRMSKMVFASSPNRFIGYVTDASGTLLRKQQYDNINGTQTLMHTTDYIDNFVYLDGVLQYFSIPEGRVVNNAGTLTQEFTITDQQGNARVSFNTGTTGAAQVVQENSYYGFGLIMPGSAVMGGSNKNLYNGGSEWQSDYVNLPDYYRTYYRNYDAALGRFMSVDPKAESAANMTTYQYAGNNPIMNNDPMGDKAKVIDQQVTTPNNTSLAPGISDFIASLNLYFLSDGSDQDLNPQQVDQGGGGGGGESPNASGINISAGAGVSGTGSTPSENAGAPSTSTDNTIPTGIQLAQVNISSTPLGYVLAEVVIYGQSSKTNKGSNGPFSYQWGTSGSGAFLYVNYTPPRRFIVNVQILSMDSNSFLIG
jgi:RHS repeat-associated protein